ncbi:hypothetical protein OG232_29405 [Streptomyces sp. NBC_01411]|uniref:hypothetical protein n=1 Tax=Streptomyces sp. NBC_01411 TaxID=2903857 RepID=UPI003255C256
MKFRKRTLEMLGDLNCGNLGASVPQGESEPAYFPYRSSMYITEFFAELDMDWEHDGSTRHRWVAGVLEQLLAEPHEGPAYPPESICRVIDHLMNPADALSEGLDRPNALRLLNDALAREVFVAFYGEDKHCYLRHVGTNTVSASVKNPHRPLSVAEMQRRAALASFMDTCSEDTLIEEVLLPLFRQLGFQRITAAGL